MKHIPVIFSHSLCNLLYFVKVTGRLSKSTLNQSCEYPYETFSEQQSAKNEIELRKRQLCDNAAVHMRVSLSTILCGGERSFQLVHSPST